MKPGAYLPCSLEAHVVDRCNLKCRGCSHFAPLVEGDSLADPAVFRRDIERFHRLFEDVYEIRLLGGEPLLHPELPAFFDVVRDFFPRARLALYTNGLELMSRPETFWKACAGRRVLVKVTNYPVGLPTEKIAETARRNGVRIKIPPPIRTFFRTMNFSGDSDPRTSFRNCRILFKTPQIRDGKLYPCFLPAYVHFLSAHFGLPIAASDEDRIDLFRVDDPSAILRFLDQPIPMCRWCLERRSFDAWGLSNREMGEWAGTNAPALPHFFRSLKYRAIHLYQETRRRCRL